MYSLFVIVALAALATTNAATSAPTYSPTNVGDASPTTAPTEAPTEAPTFAPTEAPTAAPTVFGQASPTVAPTFAPTNAPSFSPTDAPTFPPTFAPTDAPTFAPTFAPTEAPTFAPTFAATDAPTVSPTNSGDASPTTAPTFAPTFAPTVWPTSMPTYTADGYQKVWDKKRSRTSGFCDNSCSGNGVCQLNVNCKCFKGADGEYQWTGADCSLRTCPKSNAWVAVYFDAVNTASIKNNDLHPSVECSNKGKCDRSSGACQCYPGYEGIACQRTVCPNNCNDRGKCLPQSVLATRAGTTYDAPWDKDKHVGCYCDKGYRGPACELQECPTGSDPLGGYGNETGRDCSGRGNCNYQTGNCECFGNFYGTNCGQQSTVA